MSTIPGVRNVTGRHKAVFLLVKLPTPSPEGTLNGNHKQVRDGKRYAAHQ